MGYEIQVTIDSGNPHEQAAWWAATLGWQVEEQDEKFIREMVDAGHSSEDDTLLFHGRLVWKIGAAIVDPDRPSAPRVLFQWVPESKTVKNRLHFDMRVGEDREAVARSLVEAGASIAFRSQLGPSTWITMTDPEGNEFCLS
ncbi:VOC family protein [Rhodococcus sp. PAMC28707]|uniref:VOC family protein n=1 Tax=unclassified Rhodococcus (in: high G+C Gram-positive bacteria) TaxID=192944 RepID=UPI00109D8ACB|nr:MULTISPECIES: VOC family protein [unclassified Rhodococcus (in: high G+C Gram-positive bacteria)]QCB50167.1 VOC family protein [Rhodococcus sp. PAMC28705]QCB58140.1 VOC family protein [Rhodococcus sp. PAMC28707]